MPWNKPGGSGGNKDPWGKRSDQRPPDLDEIVRRIQKRLGGLFGGGRKGGGEGDGGGSELSGKLGIGFLAILALVIWFFSGFYIVREGEAGIVLRFGQFAERTGPGLRWRLPYPIETKEIVPVDKVQTVEVGYRTSERTRALNLVPKEALMLTADENIIDIQFAVQYKVKEPKDLLFNVADTGEAVVRAATETAVREIVGKSNMDFVITGGRAEVVQKAIVLVQEILDRYQTGIQIVTIEMQNAQPPAEVKPAFDDAVKAREDEERKKNEAEAYSNDVIPRARGQAARLLQEAEGYRARVIARAQGEAQRFNLIVKEYQKAPAVTRERLYIEAMEQVLNSSSKVLMDQKGGNMLYLPLDRILQQRGETPAPLPAAPSAPEEQTEPAKSEKADSARSRENLRKRSP